jgi:glycolate oxidase FAD binding subunit
LRWLASSAPAGEVREAARRAGGHATLFRAADKSAGAFAPLEPLVARLHRDLKRTFDPAGIFNPGRLYPEL